MNILILNGSPRGEQSNTLKITNAFVEGLQSKEAHEITRIEVRSKKIGHCLGCFACWKDTPGVCIINDDMSGILPRIIAADLVIWSFPLYYYSLPSKIKALMDRMLPLNLPFMEANPNGGATHPSRYDLSAQRTVLISTCGFYTATNNYEALDTQFDIAFGKSTVTKILTPQGELFSRPELRTRTGEYLAHVRAAGAQYAQTGTISPATRGELSTPLYPEETYAQLADASWGIQRIHTDTGHGDEARKSENLANAHSDPSSFFIVQMAALYNPKNLAGSEALLEINFTDLNVTHRLHLGKTECTLLGANEHAETALPAGLPAGLPTTRIETPFTVWQEISNGTLDGSRAMMDGKYRVLGNFDLMLKMDTLFSGPETAANTAPATPEHDRKKANMSLVILPWLPLWIALPISVPAGLLATLASLVLFQLAGFKWKIGAHERIAFASVTVFALAIAAGANPHILIPLSYIAFGSHWLLSCLHPVPLSAAYSSAGYGGEAAYKNPLFMRTNRIISAVWGALYLATGVWTWFLITSPVAPLSGAINSFTPALCGLWTAWFQKWYPAKVAQGK